MKNNDVPKQHINQAQAAAQAQAQAQSQSQSQAQALCTALFQFRDALTNLSLHMKDWQFEHDLERRAATELVMQELLEKSKLR